MKIYAAAFDVLLLSSGIAVSTGKQKDPESRHTNIRHRSITRDNTNDAETSADTHRNLDPTPNICNLPPLSDTNLHAIVIGAGMAGLTAAAVLHGRNKNVIVLEGYHQVGGRMRTKTDFGEPAGAFTGIIEEGANWIYGGYADRNDEYDDPDAGPRNPIRDFVLDTNQSFSEELFDHDGIDMYDNTQTPSFRLPERKQKNKGGGPYNVEDVVDNFFKLDEKVSTRTLKHIFKHLDNKPERALGALDGQELLNEVGWTVRNPLDEVMEVAVYDEEVLSPPSDASQLSTSPWGYEDFGYQITFVTGQNGGLTEVARKYAENNGILDRIVFNANVTIIDYKTSTDGVKVVVDVKDESDKITTCELAAEAAIFTGSQGVIDKYKDTLFDPPIDTSYRQVELRTWIKVFMQWNEAFWNNNGAREGDYEANRSQFNYIFTAEEVGMNRNGVRIWFNLDYENVGGGFRGDDPDLYSMLPGSRLMFGWINQENMDNFADANGFSSPNHVFDCDNPAEVAAFLQPLWKAFDMTDKDDYYKMPSACYATTWQHDEFTFGSWNVFKDAPELDNNDYYNYYNPRNEKLWLSGASSCRRSYRNMQGAHFAGARDGNWLADTLDNDGTLTNRPDSICDEYAYPLPQNYRTQTWPVETWPSS